MAANLRILKKLSKRAAPLLPLLGDDREQFPAKPCDCYTSLVIKARKHWERSHCHPSFEGYAWDIVYKTRKGRFMVMRRPSHPRKGTVMVGAMSGYYEPEWTEETAWEALSQLVHCHFTDWEGAIDSGSVPRPTRRLDTPSDIFLAARELVDAIQDGQP